MPIIRKLKSHFAHYSCLCIVVSDNGPPIVSTLLMNFFNEWDFEHRTASPYNSKANGKAESAVKMAKSLLRKNKERDQFLALLMQHPKAGNRDKPCTVIL